MLPSRAFLRAERQRDGILTLSHSHIPHAARAAWNRVSRTRQPSIPVARPGPGHWTLTGAVLQDTAATPESLALSAFLGRLGRGRPPNGQGSRPCTCRRRENSAKKPHGSRALPDWKCSSPRSAAAVRTRWMCSHAGVSRELRSARRTALQGRRPTIPRPCHYLSQICPPNSNIIETASRKSSTADTGRTAALSRSAALTRPLVPALRRRASSFITRPALAFAGALPLRCSSLLRFSRQSMGYSDHLPTLATSADGVLSRGRPERASGCQYVRMRRRMRREALCRRFRKS